MAKEIKNISASVKERLRNIATQTGKDYQSLLRQYVQERFLFRLSISPFVNNFILKGALLFLAHDIGRLRPTRDIDFLGSSISNNKNEILEIVIQILRIDFEFPTLLDFPAPQIKVYSIESAVAEKFEAIASLQLQTSRMKDFYDILFFAGSYQFKKDLLKEAIQSTFNHRETDIQLRTAIFKDKFKTDDQLQRYWSAFLTRNKLTAEKDFAKVVDRITSFIEPIFDEKTKNNWDFNSWKWI